MSRDRSRSREREAPRERKGPSPEECKLFVGNLSFDTQEQDLRDLFKKHGEVTYAKVITDRDTGRPRGFGFVTMSTKEEGAEAMERLQGYDLHGREIRIDESKDRSAGGGGGGGGGDRDRNLPTRNYGNAGGGYRGDDRGGGRDYGDRGGGGGRDYREREYSGGRDHHRDDRGGGGRDRESRGGNDRQRY